jgi:hypothetical protein
MGGTSLFQQFNYGFKLKERCKNLQVYGLTETPAKFQTTSFQCQLASAHQKYEEIGGLSPYSVWSIHLHYETQNSSKCTWIFVPMAM